MGDEEKQQRREFPKTAVVAMAQDFGAALKALKSGARVRRAGWNGKGMWLSLTRGQQVASEKLWSPHNADFARIMGGSVRVLDYITMKTADDCIVPWLASQTDVLAEDWEVIG